MLLFVVIVWAISVAASFASRIVIDGDTIEIGNTTYRIFGIDAPEYGQKCGKAQCGKEALEAMERLVRDKDVWCDTITKDNYGRSVAKCYAGNTDLGATLVKYGMAWAYVKYSTDYVEEEAIAKLAGIGIWKTPTQPAWEYRAQRWNDASQKAPKGCPIKGNISKNGKIYHPPWSPWYSRTKINLSKGERWFCDEAEAKAAGWRAPRWR